MARRRNSQKTPQSLTALTDMIAETNYFWELFSRRTQNLARGFGFWKIETHFLEDPLQYEDLVMERGSLAVLQDPDGVGIALKPKPLPGILKAYSAIKWPEEHKLSKWYYFGPVMYYDSSTKKYHAVWEYGFEILGQTDSLVLSQLITLVVKVMHASGIEKVQIEINNIGTVETRKGYNELLISYLKAHKYDLCSDCADSINGDPLQIFRCLNSDCAMIAADAPQIIDNLDAVNRKEFTDILESLDEIGVNYIMNPLFVGAPDSTGIVFCAKCSDGDKEYILGYGSGHDELMENYTDAKIPCFGFSGKLDNLQSALKALNMEIQHHDIKSDVYLVPLGDLASKKALKLFSELWDAEVSVHDHFGNIGVKNQLKVAENAKASIALIIGQKEAMDEMVILRDVKSGMQEVFQYERIIDEVKKRLGK